MISKIKIGIVEDELIIAERIKQILIGIGYQIIEPVTSYDEAIEMVTAHHPDFLLLDINLNGKKDGIDLAKKINETIRTPYIFLTANSDGATLERAKAVNPYAYLVKPFSKEELFASIEIAFNNYAAQRNLNPQATTKNLDFIFVREDFKYVKIQLDDILFLESQENYVAIRLKTGKTSMVRSTLSDFLQQLPAARFSRVHRSYVVQMKWIDNVLPTELVMHDAKVPVSSSYKARLLEQLGIRE